MPMNSQYPQVSHDDALKHIDNNGVAIYWRPGCPFCERLEYGLGEDGQKATWTNIWEDPAAKEYVASLNDGNSTVPTVVTKNTHFIAAAADAPDQVRQLLANATLATAD